MLGGYMTINLADFDKLVRFGQFPIGWPGQWCANSWLAVKRGGPSSIKLSNNPNTGQALLEFSYDKDSVHKVINESYEARARILALPLTQRLEYVRRFRLAIGDFQDLATKILRIEAGKPRWEATSDVASSMRYLDWILDKGESVIDELLAPAHLGRKPSAFRLLPVGMAAAYLPFSTPFTSFVQQLTATMLAGCPLLLCSSSHATLSAMFFALASQEADFPPSTLNVVFGSFNTFKQIVSDKRVAAVMYTGSREHCDWIRAESRNQSLRQNILQSGGKNAVIVHSSADLDLAVKSVVYGALKSSGQRCTSTSRVFVYKQLSEEFRDHLVGAFSKIAIGRTDIDDTHAKDPFMGPLYSDKAVQKYLRFQTMANRESDKTLLWGKAEELGPGGNFVSPSLHYLSEFDNSSAYQGNILFSPDVAVYDYEVLDTAIEQINTTDAAFAVSFVGDPEILRARRELFLAPNLLLNMPTVELEATLPLAGRLQSGHHRFHGPGMALYLCYPQVLCEDSAMTQTVVDWHFPGW